MCPDKARGLWEQDAQRETGQTIQHQEACTGGATPFLQLQTAGKSDVNCVLSRTKEVSHFVQLVWRPIVGESARQVCDGHPQRAFTAAAAYPGP